MAVGKAAAGGEDGVPGHLLQHLLVLFQGDVAVLNAGDGQQILYHNNEGVGVVFDVPQHGHVLGGDLRAAQQHRGGTGDGGEGGAQVVGHRPEDVAPDGLPGGLQLDGRLLGVEPLVELVQGFGALLLTDGLRPLVFGPGGQGAHHAGDGHHRDHGHRIARVAQREGGVGHHEEEVDAEAADDGGDDAIGIPLGEQRDHDHRQHKDQGGVVFAPGVVDQNAAGQIGPAQEQGGDDETAWRLWDAEKLLPDSAIDALCPAGDRHGGHLLVR